MKKLVSLLLALSLVFVMFAVTACGEGETKDTEGNGTNAADTKGGDTQAPKGDDTQAPDNKDDDTQAPDDGNGDGEIGENEYPYEGHDIVPMSVLSWDDGGYAYGAPDTTSEYLPVDPENVIHDGKGTWNNDVKHIATKVFDMSDDADSIYDCDEGCGTVNDENMEYGIVIEDWDNDTSKTGYVGAYYESGVTLRQIRWFPRAANIDRNAGGYFEGSTDGTTWTLIAEIEANAFSADFQFIDVPEDLRTTVFNYIRYVGPKEGYCNMNEIEFWGNYAG